MKEVSGWVNYYRPCSLEGQAGIWSRNTIPEKYLSVPLHHLVLKKGRGGQNCILCKLRQTSWLHDFSLISFTFWWTTHCCQPCPATTKTTHWVLVIPCCYQFPLDVAIMQLRWRRLSRSVVKITYFHSPIETGNLMYRVRLQSMSLSRKNTVYARSCVRVLSAYKKISRKKDKSLGTCFFKTQSCLGMIFMPLPGVVSRNELILVLLIIGLYGKTYFCHMWLILMIVHSSQVILLTLWA